MLLFSMKHSLLSLGRTECNQLVGAHSVWPYNNRFQTRLQKIILSNIKFSFQRKVLIFLFLKCGKRKLVSWREKRCLVNKKLFRESSGEIIISNLVRMQAQSPTKKDTSQRFQHNYFIFLHCTHVSIAIISSS